MSTAILDRVKTELVTPWPIIPSHRVTLSPTQERKALSMAARLKMDNPKIDTMNALTPDVSAGWEKGPTLYLEDHRGVALVPEKSAKAFEYRMLGLAGDEDAYLLSGGSNEDFEANLRRKVGLGRPRIINLDLDSNVNRSRLAQACQKDKMAMAGLVEMAQKAGRLNIVAYQVTYDVWGLAFKIAKISGCPVSVAGPDPILSKLANDKLWFTNLARQLLGANAIPKTFEAYNCMSAAMHIQSLSSHHKKLIVKIPDSAGGLGNMTFVSKDLQDLTITDIYKMLRERLRTKFWSIGDPFLIGVWDDDVVSSPSVQLWVPERKTDIPIIEGIFAQVVQGNSGAFVGAQRTNLSKSLTKLITSEATQIARVLQYLGYYGRLSLDTVLIKPLESSPKIHWIEANARWGGVSIPMTIGNKITGDNKLTPVFILQRKRKNTEKPSVSKKLTQYGIAEISLYEDRRKGFVQLLPNSESVELIAAYDLDSRETAIIREI